MYLLVITGGECEEDPGHECVMAAVEVESRDQAREVAPRIRALGEHPHFMVTHSLVDYFGE